MNDGWICVYVKTIGRALYRRVLLFSVSLFNCVSIHQNECHYPYMDKVACA